MYETRLADFISWLHRALCDWAAFHSEFRCFLFHPRASSLGGLLTDPWIYVFPLGFVHGWGSSRWENLQN